MNDPTPPDSELSPSPAELSPSAAARRARARGLLLGQLCADALASGPAPDPSGELSPGPGERLAGQVSHELALVAARACASEGRYDPERVAAAYVTWGRSAPPLPDPILRRAFGDYPESRSLAEGLAARACAESLGAGALTRVAPLALLSWAQPDDERGAWLARDVRLSHSHPVCRHAAVLLGHALAVAVRDGGEGPSVYAATAAFAAERRWHPDVLSDLERPAEPSPAELPPVRAALRAALRHLQADSPLEVALRDALSGPAPLEAAAVVGAALGAVRGVDALPVAWRTTLLACRSRRGPSHQTGDAERLADALLEAGARLAP